MSYLKTSLIRYMYMYYCVITYESEGIVMGTYHDVLISLFASSALILIITIGEHGDLQDGSGRGHPGRPPLHNRRWVCLQWFPWRWHHVPRSSWMLQSSAETLEPWSLSRSAKVLCISGRPGRPSVCTRWAIDHVSSRGFRVLLFHFI